MAILEAILTSQYQGQLVINRWHYVSSGDSGPVTDSFALLSAIGGIAPSGSPAYFESGTMLQGVQNVCSLALKFVSCYVRNLYDPTDFVESAFNTTTSGNFSGTASSPTLAYGFTSGRIRTDIRRGTKRFSGVVSEALNPGGVLAGGITTPLVVLASRMSATLTYTSGGASLSLAPAVLGFEEYTTPRGNRAYRKYSTEAAQLAHAALNPVYSVMPNVRTQVSRQYSRGA